MQKLPVLVKDNSKNLRWLHFLGHASSVKRQVRRSRPKYRSLSPLSPELDQGHHVQVNGIFQVQKVQHPSMKGSLGRTFQTGAPVGMCANKEKPCGSDIPDRCLGWYVRETDIAMNI